MLAKKRVYLSVVVLASVLVVISLLHPFKKTHSANFTSASATLSNARFSYRAGATSGTSGSPTVVIDGSSNADNNTNHLFPKDVVCFSNATENGCVGNTTYTVANIIN